MIDQIPALIAGERRVAAKMITLVENGGPEKQELLKALYPHTGKAYVLGITGSPGAGKSSLTDRLISGLRKQGKKVGVVAVDPTSPFTGGAILGDRIRMNEHYMDKDVFIRSMGTRGSLGGLARATKEVLKVLDVFGCDYILVETVGVGQSELEIMTAADTTVVVLTPGAGDSIQAIKAGIMEIADVFAVNKADLEGADRVVTEIEVMLDLGARTRPGTQEWRPPVVRTVAMRDSGIDQLLDAVQKHRDHLETTGKLADERKQRIKLELREVIEHHIKDLIRNKVEKTGEWDRILDEVIHRTLDPNTAAEQVLEKGLASGEPQ
ncbi:methylmalonyl Co-A mutase-associated GTPase MeaB [Heliobacterium gestii]|uniref:Methylmalonyl Co-A mutase-associated GTPase MeaB n=1 Tax=Heliomicrobium gestii TaxID=2699 RepID=A0A845LFG7_HELGE|nr:methylmalonyl Co-A mutase-associated GTPase MeaB [Heliomicrobium gestii]MBM7866824.1 LAO/AO transport system kinase [Heliomicrobium gestii]MZP42253.1 methylmalonyl Co-A mutase-associated GTPase MeaB [Heliomicrobium gestii]